MDVDYEDDAVEVSEMISLSNAAMGLHFLPQSWFSGKWLYLKGDDPIGDTLPFFTKKNMIMGGRVNKNCQFCFSHFIITWMNVQFIKRLLGGTTCRPTHEGWCC